MILASEEAVTKHNLTPLARLVGYGVAGEMLLFTRKLFGCIIVSVAANSIERTRAMSLYIFTPILY